MHTRNICNVYLQIYKNHRICSLLFKKNTNITGKSLENSQDQESEIFRVLLSYEQEHIVKFSNKHQDIFSGQLFFRIASAAYICTTLYYEKIDSSEEQRESLGREFDTEEVPSKVLSISIYSHVERFILSIKEAKDKDVQNKLKVCGFELKFLMILLANEFKKIWHQLMPLVVIGNP